jgi:hypothetical protein
LICQCLICQCLIWYHQHSTTPSFTPPSSSTCRVTTIANGCHQPQPSAPTTLIDHPPPRRHTPTTTTTRWQCHVTSAQHGIVPTPRQQPQQPPRLTTAKDEGRLKTITNDPTTHKRWPAETSRCHVAVSDKASK